MKLILATLFILSGCGGNKPTPQDTTNWDNKEFCYKGYRYRHYDRGAFPIFNSESKPMKCKEQ